MHNGKLFPLLHIKILRAMRIHGVYYIGAFGAVCLHLCGNKSVNKLRIFKSKTAVYKIVLIINYYQEFFHKCSPSFIKKFFNCKNVVFCIVFDNKMVA